MNKCTGPFNTGFFSVNRLEIFLEICYNLKNIFFSLAYFFVKIQCRIPIKCMLRLPVNSKLLVVKLWGHHNLYVGF